MDSRQYLESVEDEAIPLKTEVFKIRKIKPSFAAFNEENGPNDFCDSSFELDQIKISEAHNDESLPTH